MSSPSRRRLGAAASRPAAARAGLARRCGDARRRRARGPRRVGRGESTSRCRSRSTAALSSRCRRHAATAGGSPAGTSSPSRARRRAARRRARPFDRGRPRGELGPAPLRALCVDLRDASCASASRRCRGGPRRGRSSCSSTWPPPAPPTPRPARPQQPAWRWCAKACASRSRLCRRARRAAGPRTSTRSSPSRRADVLRPRLGPRRPGAS